MWCPNMGNGTDTWWGVGGMGVWWKRRIIIRLSNIRLFGYRIGIRHGSRRIIIRLFIIRPSIIRPSISVDYCGCNFEWRLMHVRFLLCGRGNWVAKYREYWNFGGPIWLRQF